MYANRRLRQPRRKRSDGSKGAGEGKRSSVTQRVITGVFAVAFVILLIVFHRVLLHPSVLIAMLVGVYEVAKAFHNKMIRPVKWTAYAFVVLLLPALWFKRSVGMYALFVVMCMVALGSLLLRPKVRLEDLLASLFLLVYPVLPLGALLLLPREPAMLYTMLMTLVFVLSVCSDTGAFLFGSLFGRRKLCPHISPKKTVEGAFGGVGMALFGTLVTYLCFTHFGGVKMAWYHVPVLGILGSVAAQIGDLVASLIKRKCGIKDFGAIIPGHGGLMDRLDSIIFCVVFVSAYSLMFLY